METKELNNFAYDAIIRIYKGDEQSSNEVELLHEIKFMLVDDAPDCSRLLLKAVDALASVYQYQTGGSVHIATIINREFINI
jgi:hypothetical protein